MHEFGQQVIRIPNGKPTQTWEEYGKLSTDRDPSLVSNPGPWSREVAVPPASTLHWKTFRGKNYIAFHANDFNRSMHNMFILFRFVFTLIIRTTTGKCWLNRLFFFFFRINMFSTFLLSGRIFYVQPGLHFQSSRIWVLHHDLIRARL